MHLFGGRASATMALQYAIWAVVLAVAGGVGEGIREHLGSKAPYDPPPAESCHVEPPEGCSAIFVTGLFRHGSRNPGKRLIQACKVLEEKLQGVEPESFAPEHRSWIRSWASPFELEEASLLASSGVEQMFGIGQRMRRRFPELFDRYSPIAHRFRSTYKERAARSAAAFAAGLFEGTGPPAAGGFEPVVVVTPEKGSEDRVLRFFDACPRFQDVYEESKGHYDAYVHGSEIAAVAKRIQERMLVQGGGGGGLELSGADAMAIHEYCAFQISLWNQSGEMCSLLEEPDARAAEFALDIKHWYKSSHGLEINAQMTCPLLSEMLRALRAAAEEAAVTEKGRSTNFRNGPRNATRKASQLLFAHGETLLPLLSRLLLVPPGPAPNPADSSRPFRTSRLIPMSSNLLFVLYKCPSDFQVLALHNERAVGLPACGGRLFCPLSSALSALLPPDDRCHFDQLCHSDPPSPAWATGWDTVISWEGNGYSGLISVNVLLWLLLAGTLLALGMSFFVSRAAREAAIS